MRTLDDAWRWYGATRRQLSRMQRLGRKYWAELPWAGRLERDNLFGMVQSDEVVEETAQALDPLGDLAVLVLFSVFEATVREWVSAAIEPELLGITHPTLRHAAEAAREAIDDGSFFRVLEPYKRLDPGLIEEVNQVRRYRNWVAHGRRRDEPASVTPESAYDRLSRFLALLRPSAPETDA